MSQFFLLYYTFISWLRVMLGKMIFWILLFFIIIYVSLLIFPKKTFRFLGIISAPFIRLYIKRRIALGLEDKNRFTERFGIPSKERPSGDLIWIHAVSVGEALSVIPIIEKIKTENSNINILLTTTTLTAAKQVEEKLKDLVIHQFLPFDVFKWVRRFVKYWKPAAALFIESELWPNTLYYLCEKDIPIYLLNARISNKSLKRMKLAKKLLKIFPFSLFQTIYSPSSELKKDLKELGAKEVTVVPNMKTISKKLPVNSENSRNIKKQILNRKAWLVVSTHSGEEEIILETHKLIKQTYPEILTIIAIRHPKRVNDLLEICKNLDISAATYTYAFSNEHIDEEIYIIDKIGCLGDFFENVKTVFVGGSLVPDIGGHNFLEPLNFDCNVATGPYIDNFRDIYPEVKEICKILKNQNEISEFVIESIKNGPSIVSKDRLNAEKKWEGIVRQILYSSIRSL